MEKPENYKILFGKKDKSEVHIALHWVSSLSIETKIHY